MYSYDKKDKSLAQSLVGSNFVDPTSDLPMIPIAFSNIAQLLSYPTTVPPIQSNVTVSGSLPIGRQGHRPIKLTPVEREQLQLAQMTDTDLACYIAPPDNTILDMDMVYYITKFTLSYILN